MGKVNDLWAQFDWLRETKLLLKSLKDFLVKDSKSALILRHSKRFEPSPWEEDASMELTDDGLEAAFVFGRKLPPYRNLKLYYSPVKRCQETAEQIHKGYLSIGGNSEIYGEFNILQGIGLDKESFIIELRKYPIHIVVKNWVAGLYPKDKWPSYQKYYQKAAEVITTQLVQLEDNTLAVFITHDIHLMILRLGWFGLPITDKWISYLDGFAFSFENDKIKLLDSAKIELKEIPNWWNKTYKK